MDKPYQAPNNWKTPGKDICQRIGSGNTEAGKEVSGPTLPIIEARLQICAERIHIINSNVNLLKERLGLELTLGEPMEPRPTTQGVLHRIDALTMDIEMMIRWLSRSAEGLDAIA